MSYKCKDKKAKSLRQNVFSSPHLAIKGEVIGEEGKSNMKKWIINLDDSIKFS